MEKEEKKKSKKRTEGLRINKPSEVRITKSCSKCSRGKPAESNIKVGVKLIVNSLHYVPEVDVTYD